MYYVLLEAQLIGSDGLEQRGIPGPSLERLATLVPSRNRMRKRSFTLVKGASLSETMVNSTPRDHVRKSVPMCCVCERLSLASIFVEDVHRCRLELQQHHDQR